MIRAHYLKEISQLKNNDLGELNNIKSKYVFETLVSEIDFFKTYTSFLLQTMAKYQNRNIDLMADYDIYVGLTGKIVLKDYDAGTQHILDDEQLYSILQNSFQSFLSDKSINKKEFKEFFETIKKAQDNFESFNKFCKQNLRHFIPYLNTKNLKYFIKEDYDANI